MGSMSEHGVTAPDRGETQARRADETAAGALDHALKVFVGEGLGSEVDARRGGELDDPQRKGLLDPSAEPERGDGPGSGDRSGHRERGSALEVLTRSASMGSGLPDGAGAGPGFGGASPALFSKKSETGAEPSQDGSADPSALMDAFQDSTEKKAKKDEETLEERGGRFGPGAKRPPNDERSPEEIIKANPTLANLQPVDKEELKDAIGGDFEKDPDKAFEASAVINHIEHFDGDGKIIEGDKVGDGKISGWFKKNRKDARSGANPNTEAGRFQDFIKDGYDSLKGGAMSDGKPLGGTAANGLNRFSGRPEDDDRSAEEVIEDNPVLANLAPEDKERLKKQIGDFENDADAAWRAATVLKLVQTYDADGKPLYNDAIDNGRIDGFKKGWGPRAARLDTEASRLEKFLDEGFDAFEHDIPIEGRPRDGQAENGLGRDTKRPADDDRSAEEIIEDTPSLKNLHPADARALRDMVGDYNRDPDAAWRAANVVNQIEHYDADGHAIDDPKAGNGKINGWTKDRDAKHGTEAGRFQDFIKYGYDSLKGDAEFDGKPLGGEAANGLNRFSGRPEGDDRSAEEIIEDNPVLANLAPDDKERLEEQVGDFEHDADAAYRAEIVLDMIETHDLDGKELSGGRVGNGKIDGYYKGPDGRGDPFGDNTHSRRIKSGSEAERFEKFLEEGYDVFEHDIPLDPPPTDLRDGHSAQAAAEKLRDAVRDGDAERAADLVEAGADPGAAANPDAKAGGPVSVLELAAVHDPEVARAMLEAMPEDERAALLNDVGADGNTAMHAIAASGDAELYEDAEGWGGRSDAVNDAAYTPDDIHDQVSEFIEEHEEEHGKLDKRGWKTDAVIGAGSGFLIGAEIGAIGGPLGSLVGAGLGVLVGQWFSSADPAESLDGSGGEPTQEELDVRLGAAVRIGDPDQVGKLIAAGADPTAEVAEGVSVLHYTAATGDLDLVEALVESVPEDERAGLINEAGVNGMTPLLASAFGITPGKADDPFAEVYDYLVDQGGDDTIREDFYDASAAEVRAGPGKLDRRGLPDDVTNWHLFGNGGFEYEGMGAPEPDPDARPEPGDPVVNGPDHFAPPYQAGNPSYSAFVSTLATPTQAEAGPSTPRADRIPQQNGRWDGRPGEGQWHPNNADALVWLGDQGVQFNGRRPDFEPWAQMTFEFAPGELTGNNANDFNLVYDELIGHPALGAPKTSNEVKHLLRQFGLTIHHKSRTEVMLVPSVVHNKIPHTGSAADMRNNP